MSGPKSDLTWNRNGNDKELSGDWFKKEKIWVARAFSIFFSFFFFSLLLILLRLQLRLRLLLLLLLFLQIRENWRTEESCWDDSDCYEGAHYDSIKRPTAGAFNRICSLNAVINDLLPPPLLPTPCPPLPRRIFLFQAGNSFLFAVQYPLNLPLNSPLNVFAPIQMAASVWFVKRDLISLDDSSSIRHR